MPVKEMATVSLCAHVNNHFVVTLKTVSNKTFAPGSPVLINMSIPCLKSTQSVVFIKELRMDPYSRTFTFSASVFSSDTPRRHFFVKNGRVYYIEEAALQSHLRGPSGSEVAIGRTLMPGVDELPDLSLQDEVCGVWETIDNLEALAVPAGIIAGTVAAKRTSRAPRDASTLHLPQLSDPPASSTQMTDTQIRGGLTLMSLRGAAIPKEEAVQLQASLAVNMDRSISLVCTLEDYFRTKLTDDVIDSIENTVVSSGRQQEPFDVVTRVVNILLHGLGKVCDDRISTLSEPDRAGLRAFVAKKFHARHPRYIM